MTKEEAKNFGLQLLHGIMERNESYPVYANNIKQAIDALSKPSGNLEIQNDLEEAASEYSTNEADRVWGKPDPHDYTDHSGCGAAHDNYEVGLQVGFKAGAKWDREKTMSKAVDADIMLTLHDKTGDVSLHTGYLPKELGIKYGDKVRIIIVKEDSHE